VLKETAMRVRNTVDAGAVIRDARLRRGWTQSDLAERIAVVRQTVAALERGTGAGLDVFIRAAVTLGIDLTAADENTGTAASNAARSGATASATAPKGAMVDLDVVLSDVDAQWAGRP
jgi:transcriptional regulator with XRE-family HTH domain